MSNRNKSAGNRWELDTIKFLSKWWKGLGSSRLHSRQLDNDGIDIAETKDKMPFYVQCKCTTKTVNYHKLIKEVKRKDRPLLIFHRKTYKAGKVFRKEGEYVIMDIKTFEKLLDGKTNRVDTKVSKV